MKRAIILFISFFCAINIYSQKINYYQDGTMGSDNIKALSNIGRYGFLHAFGTRYEGIKGTPNLFNSFVTSYLLVKDQKKYFKIASDIDMVRNTVVFMDSTNTQLMEISSDDVKELVFNKYDKELVYRTTKDLNFEKKIKGNKFYQIIIEEPYRLIMITFKTYIKADNEPVFNSGRHYDEFRTERKYYLEDSRGIFHEIIINNVDYNCIVHPAMLSKKALAKIYPEKKELIYSELKDKPDSVSIGRIISILDKF
jgi:hypothetical protein